MPIGWRRWRRSRVCGAGTWHGVGDGLVEHYIKHAGQIVCHWPNGALADREQGIVVLLGKLLWPANLTFSYPRWTISASDPRAYGWLLATVVLALVTAGAAMAGRSVEWRQYSLLRR